MRIGIIALVLVFLASGSKSIKDSLAPAGGAEEKATARRKLYFGILMLLLGALILIYYFASM